jgi:TatA/E family protein of Tat protein translocase
MPNIGAPELIIILVIALLVLGPGKLPEVGASIGKSLREFRKASSDVQEATKIDVSVAPIPPVAPLAPAPAAPAPVVPVVASAPDADAIAAARATLAAAEVAAAGGATESPALAPTSESTAIQH